jgi:hypothetical protein
VLRGIDQAQKAEAEAAAAAQIPPEPSAEELAAEQRAQEEARARAEFEQRRAQELAGLQSRAQEYELATANIVSALQGQARHEFSDIKSDADIAALQQRDPQRFARLQQFAQAFGEWRNHAATVQRHHQAQQQQAHAQQFSVYADQQDKLAEAAIDELKLPPKEMKAFQQACAETLRSYGMSDQDISREYQTNVLFRSAAAQQLLAAATRERLGRERAKEISAHRKAAPPPMKPGVELGLPSGGMAQVRTNYRRHPSCRPPRIPDDA